MSTAKYSAIEIANYFIQLASSKMIDTDLAEGITNLKLQKILYFTEAAHLSVFNKPLFKEEIQAWQYGPVIKEVYSEFSELKNQPIPNNDKKLSIDTTTSKFLDGIWDLFGKYSASELINISHNHTPWKSTYKEGIKNIVIDKNIIKNYYKGIFNFER